MNRVYVGATSAVLAVAIGGAAVWTALNQESSCGGNAIAGGNVAIGGPFELMNGDGMLVTDGDVIDGPTLVYFGYTFCPDVCPFDVARKIGLTGSPEQVKAASQAYKTYYARGTGEGEFYLMDHSTFTYLMLPNTGLASYFGRDVQPEEMAEQTACHIAVN
jgi:protein SCO1/2